MNDTALTISTTVPDTDFWSTLELKFQPTSWLVLLDYEPYARQVTPFIFLLRFTESLPVYMKLRDGNRRNLWPVLSVTRNLVKKRRFICLAPVVVYAQRTRNNCEAIVLFLCNVSGRLQLSFSKSTVEDDELMGYAYLGTESKHMSLDTLMQSQFLTYLCLKQLK